MALTIQPASDRQQLSDKTIGFLMSAIVKNGKGEISVSHWPQNLLFCHKGKIFCESMGGRFTKESMHCEQG